MSFARWVTGLLKIKGGTDNTIIGNDGNRLLTSPPATAFAISGLTIFKSSDEIKLSSDVTYDTLLNISGSGYLFGITVQTDNDEVELVIEIDGITIFDFSGMFLSDLGMDTTEYLHGIYAAKGDGKVLQYRPFNPARYETSLVIKARRNNKKIKKQVYTYCEE